MGLTTLTSPRIGGVSLSSSGGGSYSLGTRLREAAKRGGAPIVMASPPTFTLGSANANSTVVTANYDPRYAATDLTVFTYAGGILGRNTTTSGPPGSASLMRGSQQVMGSTAGNLRGPISIYFGTDAPDVDLGFLPEQASDVTYRIWVNGQPTAIAARTDIQALGDYSAHRVKISFGSSAPRSIRIDIDNWIDFFGVDVAAAYSCWKTPIDSPRILFVSDSYAAGQQGTPGPSKLNGFCQQLRDLIGVPDLVQMGEGGTGWLTTSVAGTRTVRGRAADIASYAPDMLMIAMGYNDNSQTAAAIQAEVTAALALMPQNIPTLVFGTWRTSGTVPAAAKSDAVRLGAIADPRYGKTLFYADTIAGNWQTTANNANYLGTDAVHPTQAGHDYLAQRIAAAYAAVLPLIA